VFTERILVIDLDGKSPKDITNTIGSSHGGYYKAREIVQNIVYRDLLPMLNAVADQGVAIILLAHAANTKITTPEGFDVRLGPQPNARTSSLSAGGLLSARAPANILQARIVNPHWQK
jgi:hypothetical protein